MGISVTLTDLSSLSNETSAIASINNNSTAIEAGFEDAVDINGDTMNGALDMNSNRIYNLPTPQSNTDPVRLGDLNALVGGGSGGGGGSGLANATPNIPTFIEAKSIVIPSTVNTLTVNGYRTEGDGGAATYTKLSNSTGYVLKTGDGAYWGLSGDTVNPYMFGAYGTGYTSPIAITANDISNNPQWRGVYGIGTNWDAVALQETIYEALALNSTSGNIIWNAHLGAGITANKRIYIKPGTYAINTALLLIGEDFVWEGSGSNAILTYTGGTLLTGSTTISSNVITNVPTAALELLSTTVNNVIASIPTLYISGTNILPGTEITSINVSAGTITLNQAATATNSSWTGYGYSGMLCCNSAAFATFSHTTFDSATVMPANNFEWSFQGTFAIEQFTSWTALVVLDHTSASPNLATQYLTFIDCHWSGGNLVDVNISVSPRGGAAEGATISFYNCSSNNCLWTAYQQGGANALGNVWHNGDFLGNSGISACCYSGTLKIDTTTFEGELGNDLGASPQTSQLVNLTSDTFFGGGQGYVTLSGLYNTRSEASIISSAAGQYPSFVNCQSMSSDATSSYRSYPYQVGMMINPSTNNTKGRLFMCVDNGGNGTWNTMTPGSSGSGSTGTFTDNTGVSYTTNEWDGYTFFFRYGSNGFTSHWTDGITSNTSNTMTVTGAENINVASNSLYTIGGVSGASEPNWDAASGNTQNPNDTYAACFLSPNIAGSWTTNTFTYVAGSTTIIGPSGGSVGNYIWIPRGDFVGVPNWTSGSASLIPTTVAPLYSKITAVTSDYGIVYGYSATQGSGYQIGDILTLSGGTGTAATFMVTLLNGSGVQAVTLLTPGLYSVLPSATSATTGGHGTGCQIQIYSGTAYTVTKPSARSVGSVYGVFLSNFVTDGNLTWATYDWDAITNAKRVQDTQVGTSLGLNGCFDITGVLGGIDRGSNFIGTATGYYTRELNQSPLRVSGYTAVSGTSYTINPVTDYLIDCTGSSSTTITLPTAVGIKGQQFSIKKTGTGNVTLATTSSQTLDGGAPPSPTLKLQYASILVESDNSNWKVI